MKKNIFKIIGGSIATITTITVVNKIINYKSTLNDYLFVPKKYEYKWRYGTISYTVTGSGKPLLLIHGTHIGANSKVFEDNIKALSANHKVYAIDLLGFGKSEKPQLTYTAYLYVQLINDFITNVIQQPTDILADSTSCSLAIMSCSQNKKYVNKLIFVNPTSVETLKKYPKNFSKLSRKILESPLLGTTIYNCLASKRSIKNEFQRNGFYKKEKVSRKIIRIYNEAAHLGGTYAKYSTASCLTKYINVDIEQTLKTLDHSIYIIYGDDNDYFNQDILNSYLELNPAIESQKIEATKMLPYIENPSMFNETCNLFLYS